MKFWEDTEKPSSSPSSVPTQADIFAPIFIPEIDLESVIIPDSMPSSSSSKRE